MRPSGLRDWTNNVTTRRRVLTILMDPVLLCVSLGFLVGLGAFWGGVSVL